MHIERGRRPRSDFAAKNEMELIAFCGSEGYGLQPVRKQAIFEGFSP
jgi:hypothetical protein